MESKREGGGGNEGEVEVRGRAREGGGAHSLEIGNRRMHNYTIKIIYCIEPKFSRR